MELSQLRYLVALAEELHFTRAAAREHIAQPALSQQIRRLEDEVGLALVERTTRRVSITAAGNLLVARARRVLAELEAADAELGALRGVQSGRVLVGALHTMGPIDLALVVAEFHRRHPSNESRRIRRLVSRGMGVAILPESDASEPGADVAVAALTEPALSRDLTLAWREGRRHPPAVVEFIALARDTYAGASA